MSSRPKIGIMGGTFNPIHYGHLFIAEAAWKTFSLDKVIFVPAGSPPHKRNKFCGDTEDRMQMTALAIASNPHFELSLIEVNRSGFSYSVDTMELFNEQYHYDVDLYFITGADAVLDIDTWYRPERLLELCRFIAATRPGFDLQRLEKLPEHWRKRIDVMDIPGLDISSTDIRQRVQQGLPIKYLLPEAVESYIFEHNLYKEAGK